MTPRFGNIAEGKMKPWHHVPKDRCLHIGWMVPTLIGIVPGRDRIPLRSREWLAPTAPPPNEHAAAVALGRGSHGA
jgi:hypothetical protein